MALERRQAERQQELWVSTAKLPTSISHVFMTRCIACCGFVETLYEPYYKNSGRPGITPSVYFRMVSVGQIEGLGPHRVHGR